MEMGFLNGACLIQPFLKRFSEGQLKSADAPLVGMVVQNCAPFENSTIIVRERTGLLSWIIRKRQ